MTKKIARSFSWAYDYSTPSAGDRTSVDLDGEKMEDGTGDETLGAMTGTAGVVAAVLGNSMVLQLFC